MSSVASEMVFPKLTSGSRKGLPNSQECSSDLVQLVPLHVCVWVVSPLSGGPFTPMVWSCSNIGMALRRVHKLVVDHVKCFKKNSFCKPTCDTFVSWSILVKSSRTVTMVVIWSQTHPRLCNGADYCCGIEPVDYWGPDNTIVAVYCELLSSR